MSPLQSEELSFLSLFKQPGSIGSPGANHGPLATAKHVHSTLWVTPPTFLFPHFLLTQNLWASTQKLSLLCSVQYDVTKSALYDYILLKDKSVYLHIHKSMIILVPSGWGYWGDIIPALYLIVTIPQTS